MTVQETTIPVTMGFVPESLAVPDEDHPGLLRAGPRASAPYAREGLEQHVCPATDGCQDDGVQPDLLELGFDVVDLSGLDAVQAACARTLAAGEVTEEDAATIRRELAGTTLRSEGGHTLTVLYLADEGFIMRTAGPNAMAVVGPRSSGMNGHGGATSVHADQDVFGTPLTQLMDGRAPELFRHDSPDGDNRDASLMLVNLWIPLQQITQPLVLADGRSVDRPRHQLRYGLATQSFLERDDDMAINDIWTFLHDPGQRWYLRSDMDHRQAYVFDTLSTAHSACSLPGEDVAEHRYGALEAAEAAVEAGDVGALRAALAEAPPDVPDATPPALREAIAAMDAVADQARRDPAGLIETTGEAGATAAGTDWLVRSRAARRRVVRMSLEMRMVVTVDG